VQLQDGVDTFDSPAAASTDGPAAAFSGSLEEAVLQNANQFHKWHAELEAACATETEQKYEQFGQLLKGYLASCSALQGKVGWDLSAAEISTRRTGTRDPVRNITP
jgi:hypothetical protein